MSPGNVTPDHPARGLFTIPMACHVFMCYMTLVKLTAVCFLEGSPQLVLASVAQRFEKWIRQYYTGMRFITMFRSTTDCIYHSGPIRL